MNALPVWDGEQLPQAAAATGTTDAQTEATTPDAGTPTASAPPTRAEPLPGAHRGAALADALATLDPSAGIAATVQHLLAAIDAADVQAGIARFDTNDDVLLQRITRIVSGASLPSRGAGTRAREVISLLASSTPA